ncbi:MULTISPECIES: YIP1 family protein [unclassified Thioalkalivibrio]|uniref:YIP1 family protein n=1 Tax=unclassified Thioalkalivibrio TaxID=2621013 RepID=UPI0003675B14|nr:MULTISPECIES: YIP1 family protein [unclassified Thioalkalivibrio]
MSSFPSRLNPGLLVLRTLTNPLRAVREVGELEAIPPWWQTFLRLALPVLLLSVIASQWLYQVIPTGLPPEAMPGAWGFGVYSVLAMSIGVLGLAWSAHYLTELFQGYSHPDRAMLAVTIGLLPAWVGKVAAAFPWPWGNTVGLLLIFYSLWLLYWSLRGILGLKRGNRIGLFVATVFCGAFITLIFGWLLMDLIPGATPETRIGTTWLI